MFEDFSAAVEEDGFHRITSINNLPFEFSNPFHGGPSSSSSSPSSSSLAVFDHQQVWWQKQEQKLSDGIRPWSNEELLCMMKIRSLFDDLFPPYFMWDHVSRKLHENGFERSGAECRCRFEEEEEEEVWGKEGKQKVVVEELEEEKVEGQFEMLKGMCEKVVRTIMEKQEEMQEKAMEEMGRRDAEKTEREEAFIKEEMNKVEKDIEMREKERVVAENRHSTIIKLLKKFKPSYISSIPEDLVKLLQSPPPHSSHPSMDSAGEVAHEDSKEEEYGRRWRREEVVALINLRCCSTKRGGERCSKGELLWEKVSKKMMEMGYRRSSKRCKEKWENINKYFRKTREGERKRPVGSRTCPYFQHLTILYGESKVVSSSTAAPPPL